MLEKVVLIASSFFCIAMELKFILQDARDDEIWSKKDPETFHAKALHLALLFLPEQCPLAQHIEETYYHSYLKSKLKKASRAKLGTTPKRTQAQAVPRLSAQSKLSAAR